MAVPFTQTIVNESVTISTANTARDGTGTIATLHTAPATGSRIDTLMIKARVTTTAGMIRFWLYDGTAYHLWKEVLVSAITASATVAAFERELPNLGLLIKTGWSLRVSTEKAEAFDISATFAGSF